MKNLFLTLVLTLFLGKGFAQDLSFLQQVELIFSDFIEVEGFDNNVVKLNQLGNSNNTIITQERGIFGNNASLNQQIGNSNDLIINQVGTNISSSNLQNGNDNSIQKNIFGTNIQSMTSQVGNANTINFILENNSGFQAFTSINQFGNGNLIDINFYSSGLGIIPDPGIILNANQIGNNHSLTGNMDSLGPQISITQFGGFFGEGMTLNLDTFIGSPGLR
jgi:hypothetical protein